MGSYLCPSKGDQQDHINQKKTQITSILTLEELFKNIGHLLEQNLNILQKQLSRNNSASQESRFLELIDFSLRWNQFFHDNLKSQFHRCSNLPQKFKRVEKSYHTSLRQLLEKLRQYYLKQADINSIQTQQIGFLSAHVSSLKSQINPMKKQESSIHSQNIELGRLQRLNQEFQKTQKEYQTKIENLENELNQLKIQPIKFNYPSSGFQNQSIVKNNWYQLQKSYNKGLHTPLLKQLDIKAQGLYQKNNNYQIEFEDGNLRNKIAFIQKEKEKLINNNLTLQKEKQTLQKELSIFKNKIAKLQQENSEYKSQGVQLISQMQGNSMFLDHRQRDFRLNEQQLNNKQPDYQKINKELQLRQQKVNTDLNDLQFEKRKIRAKEERLNEMENELKTNQSQFGNSVNMINKYEEQIKNKNKQINEIQNLLKNQSRQNQQLKAQLKLLKESNEKQSTQINNSENHRQLYQAQKKELQFKLNNTIKELQEARRQLQQKNSQDSNIIQRLEQQIQKLKEVNNELTSKFCRTEEKSRNEKLTLQNQQVVLQNEIQKIKQQIQALQRDNQRLVQQNCTFNENCIALNGELLEKYQQVQNLTIIVQKNSRCLTQFFNGNILNVDTPTDTEWFVTNIEKSLDKRIKVTRLLYRFDLENKTSFHHYFDNKPNIVLIVKMQNGQTIAAYSEPAFKPLNNTDYNPGLMFGFNNRKVFSVKTQPTNEMNRTVPRPITYDDNYIIWGNSDILIKIGSNELYSSYATSNCCYEEKGNQNPLISDLFQQKNRDTYLVDYELYQVIFE